MPPEHQDFVEANALFVREQGFSGGGEDADPADGDFIELAQLAQFGPDKRKRWASAWSRAPRSSSDYKAVSAERSPRSGIVEADRGARDRLATLIGACEARAAEVEADAGSGGGCGGGWKGNS